MRKRLCCDEFNVKATNALAQMGSCIDLWDKYLKSNVKLLVLDLEKLLVIF